MTPNHYNWKIFNAAAIVAGFSLAAKVVSAAKDLFVAAWFGAGESVDAFILGALLPLLSVSIFTAPFSSALVPRITARRVLGDEKGALQIFEANVRKFSVFLALLSVLFFLSAPSVSHFLTPNRGSLLENVILSFQIMSVLALVAGLSQCLVTVLNALEVFALPACSQAISPLGIIAALVWLPTDSQTSALAIGAVVGNIGQLILLLGCYLAKRRTIFTGHDSSSADVKTYALWREYAPLFLSAILMSSTDIIDQVMAAEVGVGAVSILSYGTKITAVLLSIVAGALASAAFPYLSQMIERDERHLLNQTLYTYTRSVLIGSCIAVLVITFFSYEITEILFERGRFTTDNTREAALIQQMAILQLPFYLLNILYMRVIMALRVGRVLAGVTVVSIALNVGLNWLFSQWYGVAGIALSTSCVYLWSATALGIAIFYYKNAPIYKDLA